jgi:GNAT superfamily N-acetyltransferase
VYPLLDNIMWNCLSGPHLRFATGHGGVRRYAAGFSPIVGFATPHEPDFETLSNYCAAGERFYCDIWNGAAPAGWQIEREAPMLKMVWEGPCPETDAAPDAVTLEARHFPQALELAIQRNPGPFGPRTPELGTYFGFFEEGRLIAMAGERMCAGNLREISAVCTHPDFLGRGLAKRLSLKLVREQMLRGEVPFLHVIATNTVARNLYEKLGFRNRVETLLRVISRVG